MSSPLSENTYVERLGHFAAALNVPYGIERSIKVSAQGLIGGRALISFHRDDLLAAGGWDKVATLLAQCGLDQQYHPPLAAAFESAELIHFGLQDAPQLAVYEPWLAANNSRKLVMKMYFESQSVAPHDPQWSVREWHNPGISPHYLAYKWHVDGAPVATHYGRSPALDDGPVGAVVATSQGQLPSLLKAGIQSLLEACNRQLASAQSQLLIVVEPATKRRSIDANLYTANLVLDDVQSLLLSVLAIVSPTNRAALEHWLAANNRAQLGHLAWGCGRQNEPFITCYYGVREVASGVSFVK